MLDPLKAQVLGHSAVCLPIVIVTAATLDCILIRGLQLTVKTLPGVEGGNLVPVGDIGSELNCA